MDLIKALYIGKKAVKGLLYIVAFMYLGIGCVYRVGGIGGRGIYKGEKGQGGHIYNPYVASRTVQITNQHTGAQGTGVYLREGFILTARHIYSGDGGFHNSSIMHSNGSRLTPVAIFLSERSDMAIIQVKELISHPASFSGTKWFNSVVLIGNPAEGDFEQANSYLIPPSLVLDPETVSPHLMLSFPCQGARPGYSGAGIFNEYNELIGLFTMYNPIFNLCYGWDSREIRYYVNEMNIPGLAL